MKTNNRNHFNKLAIVALALALTASCKPKQEGEEVQDDQQVVQAPAETSAIAMSRDSLELAFVKTLDAIDKNLEEIIARQRGIEITKGREQEDRITVNEKIIRNIQLINSLMAENKERLNALEKQMRGSKSENKRLKDLVAQTEEKLKANEQRLEELKADLSGREFQLTDLNKKMGDVEMKNQMLTDMVSKYERDLNTAYYVAGSYKELKDEGVVKKAGPLKGIGVGESTVKKDFVEGAFTKIDIRETKSIPVNAKKAKVVSNHASDSYEFKKEGDVITELEIKDPEEFWKADKFLVMEVKGKK